MLPQFRFFFKYINPLDLKPDFTKTVVGEFPPCNTIILNIVFTKL